MDSDIRYDRRVSDSFLVHFIEGGFAQSLVTFARSGLYPLDLQMRSDPRSGAQHATLYTGLTAVLNVKAAKGGSFKLTTHPTHMVRGGFHPTWAFPATEDTWAARWPDVEMYLERIIPLATKSHGRVEGAVQAAVAAYPGSDRVILDREVTPSFRDKAFKAEVLEECRRPILEALAAKELHYGAVPSTFGAECDALGIDADGRLLAIEIKPLQGGSIAWVAAQATMYARVLQQWIDIDDTPGDGPDRVLRGMLRQRHALGLSGKLEPDFSTGIRVTPVVALQRGASPEMVNRMLHVRRLLAEQDLGVPEVEVFEVSLTGELIPLDETKTRERPLRSRGPSYVASENARAERWKRDTDALPHEARLPGPARSRSGKAVDVAYCLPRHFASLNLLPEVRKTALQMFADRNVAWHSAVDGGPSNHLRSSQVQCVNALTQMAHDPERLKLAFGTVLDIADVLEIEPGRHLMFEFVSPVDYHREGNGKPLTPGAKCTSIDAAFKFRSSTGANEIALVEWKYTEAYPQADPKAASREAERHRRYDDDILDPDGPLDGHLVPIGELFHEPLYQLVRQQLLAHRLEKDKQSIGVDVVRVVHVLSPNNLAYERSYLGDTAKRLGPDVSAAWQTLLQAKDRFVKLDSAVFLNPRITSDLYCERYGADA